MRRLGIALALVLGLAPIIAEAQCAEARERGEATAGHCCRPGQRWDAGAARCEGPPRCPAGLTAESDACLFAARARSAAAARSTELSMPPAAAPADIATLEERIVRSPIEELIITGALTAISGFSFSIIVGVGLSILGDSTALFVPLLGGFMYIVQAPSEEVGMTYGLPGSGLRLAGFLLMLIAFWRTRPRSPTSRRAARRSRPTSSPGLARPVWGFAGGFELLYSRMVMTLRFSFTLALCFGLGFAQVAHAQCAEGREITDATAGRCCWPGQHWNAEAGRCEGPPRCPAGRFAEGDTCVAATTASYAGTPSAAYGSSSAMLASPGSMATPGSQYLPPVPAHRQPPRTIRTPIEELVVTGALIAISAYSYSIIAGAIHLTSCCNGSPWVMFIPLAGGFIYPAVDSYYGGTGELFGIPGSALQTIGLLLMIIGAVAHESSVVSSDPHPWRASLTPEVVAGPGEVGLGLRWSL